MACLIYDNEEFKLNYDQLKKSTTLFNLFEYTEGEECIDVTDFITRIPLTIPTYFEDRDYQTTIKKTGKAVIKYLQGMDVDWSGVTDFNMWLAAQLVHKLEIIDLEKELIFMLSQRQAKSYYDNEDNKANFYAQWEVDNNVDPVKYAKNEPEFWALQKALLDAKTDEDWQSIRLKYFPQGLHPEDEVIIKEYFEYPADDKEAKEFERQRAELQAQNLGVSADTIEPHEVFQARQQHKANITTVAYNWLLEHSFKDNVSTPQIRELAINLSN